jgi:hypothetical protein
MGKKKDARRAAKVAARERREKVIAELAQAVSVLKTRANTADERLQAVEAHVAAGAHPNDRVPAPA